MDYLSISTLTQQDNQVKLIQASIDHLQPNSDLKPLIKLLTTYVKKGLWSQAKMDNTLKIIKYFHLGEKYEEGSTAQLDNLVV